MENGIEVFRRWKNIASMNAGIHDVRTESIEEPDLNTQDLEVGEFAVDFAKLCQLVALDEAGIITITERFYPKKK